MFYHLWSLVVYQKLAEIPPSFELINILQVTVTKRAEIPQVPVKRSADVLPVPLLESANNAAVSAKPVRHTVVIPHAQIQASAAITIVQKLCGVFAFLKTADIPPALNQRCL